jgi:hypothetical protein
MIAHLRAEDLRLNGRAMSRRLLLVAGGGAALAAVAAPAAAATKMAPSAVGYRAKPQGAARCDGCTQWQAPGACKIVSGTISPNGWCTLYAPAPKS